MSKNKIINKGFTLIELLIVIGILAVLASVTLLVLNPAQMFAQARDSQRVSDLNTLRSAIGLYLATAAAIDLDNTDSCTDNFWGTFASTTGGTVGRGTFIYATATTSVVNTGWIPINFGSTAGGAPISSLPLDPTSISATLDSNTNSLYAYYYFCDSTNTTFELNCNLESTRYATDGDDDKESKDGGNKDYMYEVGTDPGLDL
ncbi:type II secretion system GspH family protein [Patescibacteria group bacterium]|nr:type II secretion system GspH family protein [Patescibacteria group bacterium]